MIITPGAGQLYKYNMPHDMGIKISPDGAQAIVEEIPQGSDILQRIAASNLKTNSLKCN